MAAQEAEEDAASTYRVRRGDTLYAIARRHGTTVERLKAWNNLKSSALRIGVELYVQQPPRAVSTQQ
ncbi:MAG: LysM peptidoglycan-binding domain-containing protein [Vicinamibacterales bacterium]